MPRTLEQWLAHQAGVHPRAIELGLERSQRVLERLVRRQPTSPVVTVAGTNGKGSVAAYCAAVLTAAGYRVGTFTSPHLRDYRERIRVHDRLVTAPELVQAFERIDAASAECGVSLTFFECNALAAFLVFEAAALDAWVLEVGMGGRLDAVNVVDPSVAVVVSIGLDHQEYLGETLEAIAREKAGIFRAGRCAVIGSRTVPAVLHEAATQRGAVAKQVGEHFEHTRVGDRWSYRGSRWNLPGLPRPALAGDVQFSNAATALAALEELAPRLTVSPAAVARGLESVRLTGRFQIIAPGPGQPTWILDVAHNPDAARVLKDNLRALSAAGRTLAVCGMLADKDVAAVAAVLADSFDAWWFVSTEGERGTTAAALERRMVPHLRAPHATAADVSMACAAAAAAAGALDRIVVFGSFHTVGPALDWFQARGLLPDGR